MNKTKNNYLNSEFKQKNKYPSCKNLYNIHTNLNNKNNYNNYRKIKPTLKELYEKKHSLFIF